MKVSDSETFLDSAPPKIFIWIQPSIYHNDTSVGQRLIIPVTTVEYYYMIILFIFFVFYFKDFDGATKLFKAIKID